MSEKYSAKLPFKFWIISVLFLLWNLVGIAQYLASVTATPESLAAQSYSGEQIEFLLTVPALYASVFALAVWSGLLAAILLLLRRKWAVPIFLISLLFVILSYGFDILSGAFNLLGVGYFGIMSFVTIISVVQYIFARKFRGRGWLR